MKTKNLTDIIPDRTATVQNLAFIKEFVNSTDNLPQHIKENINSWLHESFFCIKENNESAPQFILNLLLDNNYEELKNRFFEKITPGTAGIRGKLGVGSARINESTVGMFAQAHANYIARLQDSERKGIILAGDSRIGSYDPDTKGPGYLQKMVAEIYSAAGVPVYLSDKPLPTPLVSFTIGEVDFDGYLPVSAAINTASHNPSTDNGFKVYESGGHQVVSIDFKKGLHSELLKVSNFGMVKRSILKRKWPETKEELEGEIYGKGSFLIETNKSPIKIISSNTIIKNYCKKIASLRKLTCSNLDENIESFHFTNEILESLARQKIVITTLCGNGFNTIKHLLTTHGLKENIHFFRVKGETEPDGTFPCGYKNVKGKPNPEYRENFYQAILVAKEVKAKYVIACDPDSDRIGIGMVDLNSDTSEQIYNSTIFFNGNEQLSITAFYLGMIDIYNKNNVFIQTRVSSNLYRNIVASLGAKLYKVMVGFKYFGQISNYYVSSLIEKENQSTDSNYHKPFNRLSYSRLSHKERKNLYKKHNLPNFIHGGEESMGQNMYDYVYDKDTPASISLFTEMIGFLGLDENQKETLFQKICKNSNPDSHQSRIFEIGKTATDLKNMLNIILKKYGCFKEQVIAFKFEGAKGNTQKQNVMNFFRTTTVADWNTKYNGIGNVTLLAKADYRINIDKDVSISQRFFDTKTKDNIFPHPNQITYLSTSKGDQISIFPFSFSWLKDDIPRALDSSDYMTFFLDNSDEIHIRPSGTESFIKIYLNFNEDISSISLEEGEKRIIQRMADTTEFLERIMENFR